MRHFVLKSVILVVLATIGVVASSAQMSDPEHQQNRQVLKATNRYLFGMAVSVADSTTFLTDISIVDNMEYDAKQKTPVGLDLYTDSFRNYLLGKGMKGYLCSTFVFTTMKEAEKKLVALRNKVRQNKATKLSNAGDFRYQYINTEAIFSNSGSGQQDDEEDF